jgi:hypothetical protein
MATQTDTQRAIQDLGDKITTKSTINQQFVTDVQNILAAIAARIHTIQLRTPDDGTARALAALGQQVEAMSVTPDNINVVAQAKNTVNAALTAQGVNEALPDFTTGGGSRKSRTRKRSHSKVKKHKSKRRRRRRRR